MIVEKLIVSMRGKEDGQQFEMRKDECTNTITTVQKDNMILENKVIGGFGEKKSNGGSQYYQQDRVYSMGDVAMCHPASIPGGSYNYLEQNKVNIQQAIKEGKIECDLPGIADLNYPNSETRRGRVIDHGQCSPTLTTESNPSVLEPWHYMADGEEYIVRIRKLTPKECWRLMDFTDEDFEKAAEVNSNSQLYKQAGNSIVVNVLAEIFKNLM